MALIGHSEPVVYLGDQPTVTIGPHIADRKGVSIIGGQGQRVRLVGTVDQLRHLLAELEDRLVWHEQMKEAGL